MADKKISALTASTTPLAGTEVLPIVQSGATVKVAVSDLTAGRSVATGALTSSVTGATDKIAQFNGENANNYIAIFDGSGTSATFGSLSGGNPYIFGGTGKSISFYAGAAEKVRVNDTGNLVIVNSGNGIDFSATPGTGTSELLADYEEGTWTPNQGSGLTVVGTFFSIGQYTKVGRLVTAFGYVAGTSTVAATANAELTSNLPFTVGPRTASGAVYATGATSAASTCNAGGASTILYIATTIAATTGQIYFNVTYEV
jgi:hypothetical protein